MNCVFLFTSFAYYFGTYILQQKFQYFCGDQFKNIKSVKTDIIDDKYNFSWKSCLEKNPEQEVNNLVKVMNFLENNLKENYLLVTDYQFLNTKLINKNNIQVNKWYHVGVSYPNYIGKYHDYYKDFLMNKIRLNRIKKIIFIYPSHFGKDNEIYFKNIFSNCITNKQKLLDDLIYSVNIKECY